MASEIAGLAGVPSPQVLSVQGVPGGTPVPTTPAGGTGDVNIVEYGGVATSLGQKVSASSIPVVIASDQEVNVDVGVPDKTAFVYGTTVEQPVGGVYQDAAPGLVAGTTGAVRVTQNRAFHSNLRNDAGTEVGTLANPLRTDPTGSTTQPVSGTVTANQGAPAVVANAWPTKITDGVDTADVTAANALKVDGSAVVQPVSGTVTALQGTTPWVENLSQVGGAAVTTQAAGEQLVAVEGRAANGAAVAGNPVLSSGSDGANARSLLTDTSGRQQVVGAAADGAAVTGNPVLIAGQDGANAQSLLTDTSGRPNMVGAAAQGVAVAGNPVLVCGEDAGGLAQRLQTTVIPPVDGEPGLVVRQVVSQTATLTNVASSAVSVTLLAANTARIGATIVNDSVQALFAKFGTTASTTSFTVRIGAAGYYEVPYGYTGRIDGIWNVAAGDARITELT